MGEPQEKRCGTCRWWLECVAGDACHYSEVRPHGDCRAPVPYAWRVVCNAPCVTSPTDGQDCPVWAIAGEERDA